MALQIPNSLGNIQGVGNRLAPRAIGGQNNCPMDAAREARQAGFFSID